MKHTENHKTKCNFVEITKTSKKAMDRKKLDYERILPK